MRAQRGDVLGLVGGQDHGALLPDARDHLAEPQPLLRVEADGRLVEDEQLGFAEQGLSHTHPPPHAAGQGRIRWSATDASPIRAMTRRTSSCRARRSVELLEDGHVVDELEDGEAAVETGVLRQIAQLRRISSPVVGRARVAAEQGHGCRGPAPGRWRCIRSRVVLPAPFGPSRPVTPMAGGEGRPSQRRRTTEGLGHAVTRTSVMRVSRVDGDSVRRAATSADRGRGPRRARATTEPTAPNGSQVDVRRRRTASHQATQPWRAPRRPRRTGVTRAESASAAR